MFLSTWRKLLQQVRRNNSTIRRGKRPSLESAKAQRLQLERLEDRTLLSTFQWTGANTLVDSNWNDPANWNVTAGTPTTFYPSVVGDIAQFTGTPAQATVTLNQNITVGEIDFGTSSNITIIPNPSVSALTLDNTGIATGTTAKIVALASNTGVDIINAQLISPSPANAGAGNAFSATISGGTLTLNNVGAANSFPTPTAQLPNATSTFTVNSGGILSITAGGNTGNANITVNNGGTLSVSGNGTISGGGTVATTPTVTVNAGGTFLVTDSPNTTFPLATPIERFGGSSTYSPNTDTNINLNGGTFSYVGGSAAASVDYLGTITLTGGNSIIADTPTGAGSVMLTSAQLVRNTGATVNFTGSGQGKATNQLLFNQPPLTEGNSSILHIGILPYASVLGADFATYQVGNPNDPTIFGIGTFNDYALSIATAKPGDTVKESVGETISGNTTINGLVLGTPNVVGSEARWPWQAIP